MKSFLVKHLLPKYYVKFVEAQQDYSYVVNKDSLSIVSLGTLHDLIVVTSSTSTSEFKYMPVSFPVKFFCRQLIEPGTNLMFVT